MTAQKRIGVREVEALRAGEEIWDTAVRGFGARRRGGPSVSYFVMFRTAEGRLRRYTIGQHGAPWTPDQARTKALSVLAEAKVHGTDPAARKKAAREAANVNDLCDLYWADAEAGRLMTRQRQAKKPSTLLSDKGRIDKHIRPLLGQMKVAAVTSADVEAFMHDVAAGKTAVRAKTGKKRGLSNVRGGRGAASRTVGLLGAIFTYAMRNGMRRDNPVRGVMRPADGRRDRRLSDEEFAAFGAALATAEAESYWPAAVACARFLALTGWRSSEALGLRWAETDLARRTATLADTKTGRSLRPLSYPSCQILEVLRQREDNVLVFPASRGNGAMSGFRRMWGRMVKLGGLPADVTPHVLRHSFASVAADLGYSEPTIATLIGHMGHTVTSRYVHSADAVLLAAADKVAERIAELMGKAQGNVPCGIAPVIRRAAKTQPISRRGDGHIPPVLRPFLEDDTIFVPPMPRAFEAKDVIELARAAGISMQSDPSVIGARLKSVVELFVTSAEIQRERPTAKMPVRVGELAGAGLGRPPDIARKSLLTYLAMTYQQMTTHAPSSHDSKSGKRIANSPAVVWVRAVRRHAHDRFEQAPDAETRNLASGFVSLMGLSDATLGDLLVARIAEAKDISRKLPSATHGIPPRKGRWRPSSGKWAKVGLALPTEKTQVD